MTRSELEEIERSFDQVTGQVRDQVKLVAEGVLQNRQRRDRIEARLTRIEERLIRVEV